MQVLDLELLKNEEREHIRQKVIEKIAYVVTEERDPNKIAVQLGMGSPEELDGKLKNPEFLTELKQK
jgi:hypothetical protein